MAAQGGKVTFTIWDTAQLLGVSQKSVLRVHRDSLDAFMQVGEARPPPG